MEQNSTETLNQARENVYSYYPPVVTEEFQYFKKKETKWCKKRLAFSNSAAFWFPAVKKILHRFCWTLAYSSRSTFSKTCLLPWMWKLFLPNISHIPLFPLNTAVWLYISCFQILLDWSCGALSSISQILKIAWTLHKIILNIALARQLTTIYACCSLILVHTKWNCL